MERINAPSEPPLPRLEIRDLQLVLALASAGTTARAARALHITQSAVSRALTLSEERLGTRLFERSARGLTPTPAGERLIAGAGMVLAQLHELEQRSLTPEPEPTRLRIVCECYTAYRWLPSAMNSLRRKLPGLELEIAVEHSKEPVPALVDAEIDVALLTTAALPTTRELRGAFVERPLFSDEIVFAIARTHPLASEKHITPEHLRQHTLITSVTPPAEADWFLTRVFGKRKPKLEFLRFPLTEAIADAARAGMGIAILSEWMASGYLESGQLVVRRLATGPLRRPWRIAYRREVAEAAERLALALSSCPPRLQIQRDSERPLPLD